MRALNDVAVQPAQPAGRRLWLLWTLATCAGWAAGGWAGDVMVARLAHDAATQGLETLPATPAVTVAGATALVGGVAVGLLQALLLRRRIPGILWRWPATTLVGLISMIRLWGLGALLMSVLQWLVLRRHVARAWLWVAASTVGWTLALALVSRVSRVEGLGGVAVFAAGGAVTGITTGAAMMRLMDHG